MQLLAQGAVAEMASPVAAGSATEHAPGSKTENAKSTDNDGTPEKAEDSGWTSDFSLLEEYRLRIASHVLPSPGSLGAPLQTNQQSDQHLRLLGDGQISGFNDHFRATASGALWFDLDGPSAPGAASLFATQYDNAQPWVAIYALSAEWQEHKTLDYVRVGRQASEHGLPLTFDGASLSVRALGRKLQLFGFGGRTVHFFETAPGFFENWVASTGAVLRPSFGSAFEFDTRIIREQTLNADRSHWDSITNHSYGLSASLGSENLSSKIYARGIDRRPSHAGGAFTFQNERLGLGFDARVHAQLVTLGEVVESENPFYSLLGPSLPFVQYRFESWKDFQVGRQTQWNFHLGWRERRVVGAAEQPFNRNTGAIYLYTRLEDLFHKGLFVGGTIECDYLPLAFNRERMLTLGGFTGYGNESIKTEIGTYFQQYKLIYYQSAEELHNARTVYGSLAFRPAQWLELRARYEIDIFDMYLQSFFLSARQDF
jgi:hypothetical protein